MTSLLVAGASGAIGMALAAPAIMPKTKAVVISLFMKSLSICSAGRRPSAAGEGDAGADLADRLVDQLERAFAQKLAAAAGLSERYVNELLYEAGASFTMRLLELRLRRAADLLAHAGERRISDVAFACGFNDLCYFNRCFRRRFGLTPTAARGR